MKKRSLSMVAATVLCALPAIGGSARAGSQYDGSTITVWYDFTSSAAQKGLATLADKWAAANGATVNFATVLPPGSSNDVVSLLPARVKSNTGPDLVYIPEDQQGILVARKLIAPLPRSVLRSEDRAKYQAYALDASLVDGVAYSIPHDEDSVLLLYNKRLVKEPPATWTQLIATAKKLTRGNQYGLLYPITGGLYFNFWAYSGNGAYVFGGNGGKLNATDIGLDNAGAVQALTFIKSLTALMPANADFNVASSYFQSGRVAMTIDGQWDFDFYAKSLGQDLGGASIPALPGGRIARPFVGIRVWAVTSFSRHQQAAWDLARYLSLNGQAITARYQERLPTLKTVPGFVPNALQVASEQQFSTGILMPDIPEMYQVWTPEGDAINLVLQGKATPQTALRNALQRVKAGIATADARR